MVSIHTLITLITSLTHKAFPRFTGKKVIILTRLKLHYFHKHVNMSSIDTILSHT